MTETEKIEPTPPYDRVAERAVLGAILLEKGTPLETLSKDLASKDFYGEQHPRIYQAMLELYKRSEGIDDITLVNELGISKDREKVAYIAGLSRDVPSAGNVDYYAEIVKDRRNRRDLIKLGKDIYSGAMNDGQDIRVIVEKARKRLFPLQRAKLRKPLADLLREKQKRDSERDPNIPLGYRLKTFEFMEQDIDGLQAGFYVIGAYTKVGKTHFLINLLLDALWNNPQLRGIYFSLDDSKEIIYNRLIAHKAGLTINQIQKKQKEKENSRKVAGAYDHYVDWADEGRIEILDQSDIQSINELEQEIRLKANAGPLIVVVDDAHNIPLPDSGGMDRRGLNVEIATRLKALVDIYRIPLLATVEARKKGQGISEERPPTIDDLMETSKWGYNATVGWILHPTGDVMDRTDDAKEGPGQLGLYLYCVKSKLGSSNQTRILWLTPDTGKIVAGLGK